MFFSSVKGGRLAVRENFTNELRYFAVADREQVASRIVLETCTDPVLGPKVYGSFSDEQKLAIRNYYMQTALLADAFETPGYSVEVKTEVAKRTLEASGGIKRDDPRLNLFAAVG